jgi:hypothetical protein
MLICRIPEKGAGGLSWEVFLFEKIFALPQPHFGMGKHGDKKEEITLPYCM